MTKRVTAVTTAALGIAGAIALTAGPAAAAGTTSRAVVQTAQHCVANLDTAAVACGTSDADALRAVAPAATVKIAVFYDGANYTGNTLTWVQDKACSAGYDNEYQFADLRTTNGGNWSNRVTSVHTYNKCDVKLYDAVDFGGSSSTWIDQAANLATIGNGWSNRASSVKFS
jgi:hypothetical protein